MNQTRSKFKKSFSPTVSNQSFLLHLLLDLLGFHPSTECTFPFSLLSLCRTTQVDPLLLTPLHFDTWYILLFPSQPRSFCTGNLSPYTPYSSQLTLLPSPSSTSVSAVTSSSVLCSVSSTPPLSSLLPSHFRDITWPERLNQSPWRKQKPHLRTPPFHRPSPHRNTANNSIHYHLALSPKDTDLMLTSNLQKRDAKNNLGHKVNRGSKGGGRGGEWKS